MKEIQLAPFQWRSRRHGCTLSIGLHSADMANMCCVITRSIAVITSKGTDDYGNEDSERRKHDRIRALLNSGCTLQLRTEAVQPWEHCRYLYGRDSSYNQALACSVLGSDFWILDLMTSLVEQHSSPQSANPNPHVPAARACHLPHMVLVRSPDMHISPILGQG